MPREVEVEIPVIVNVTIPDGVEMSNEDIAEVAYDTISQQCSICIEERDGQPVQWATCWSEVLTDETQVDGKYLQTPTAGLE